MGRGRKILIGVVGTLVVLLLLNAYVTGRETGSAEVTVPGGRILQLEMGDLQIVEGGPAMAARSFCSTATPARSTGGMGCAPCSNASIELSQSTCSASAA